MAREITRTFKFFKVVIKDAKTDEILKEETFTTRPTEKKVAVSFIKETNNTNFTISINETNEVRKMKVVNFIENSDLVSA